MGHAEPDDRLSRIATQWSAVIAAHAGPPDAAEAVRNRLLLRYTGPVYRYLLGAVRDPDAAADLCQEFAVRFLRGDFRRAGPGPRPVPGVREVGPREPGERPPPGQAGQSAAAQSRTPPHQSFRRTDEFAGAWQQNLLDQTWACARGDEPGLPRGPAAAGRGAGVASAEMAGGFPSNSASR